MFVGKGTMPPSLLISLALFAAACWTPTAARVIQKRAAFYIANDTMCIVDGDVYRNGDPVPTDDQCERCTCRPPGFSCVLRDCDTKPGCKAVRKAGECCPDYVCGCVHNNRVYEDGELIKDLQNACYTCRCHGSSISCTFADCLFRGDCPPEYVPGECCPRYDHCPPLSTTSAPTQPPTQRPIVQQEEINFVNLTTAHVEKFTTPGTTVTVKDILTTSPSYFTTPPMETSTEPWVSVQFTLSEGKISSISDFDVATLTTILPVQTTAYTETTRYTVPDGQTGGLTTVTILDHSLETTTPEYSWQTSTVSPATEKAPTVGSSESFEEVSDLDGSGVFTTHDNGTTEGDIQSTEHLDVSTGDIQSTEHLDVSTETSDSAGSTAESSTETADFSSLHSSTESSVEASGVAGSHSTTVSSTHTSDVADITVSSTESSPATGTHSSSKTSTQSTNLHLGESVTETLNVIDSQSTTQSSSETSDITDLHSTTESSTETPDFTGSHSTTESTTDATSLHSSTEFPLHTDVLSTKPDISTLIPDNVFQSSTEVPEEEVVVSTENIGQLPEASPAIIESHYYTEISDGETLSTDNVGDISESDFTIGSSLAPEIIHEQTLSSDSSDKEGFTHDHSLEAAVITESHTSTETTEKEKQSTEESSEISGELDTYNTTPESVSSSETSNMDETLPTDHSVELSETPDLNTDESDAEETQLPVQTTPQSEILHTSSEYTEVDTEHLTDSPAFVDHSQSYAPNDDTEIAESTESNDKGFENTIHAETQSSTVVPPETLSTEASGEISESSTTSESHSESSDDHEGVPTEHPHIDGTVTNDSVTEETSTSSESDSSEIVPSENTFSEYSTRRPEYSTEIPLTSESERVTTEEVSMLSEDLDTSDTHLPEDDSADGNDTVSVTTLRPFSEVTSGDTTQHLTENGDVLLVGSQDGEITSITQTSSEASSTEEISLDSETTPFVNETEELEIVESDESFQTENQFVYMSPIPGEGTFIPASDVFDPSIVDHQEFPHRPIFEETSTLYNDSDIGNEDLNASSIIYDLSTLIHDTKPHETITESESPHTDEVSENASLIAEISSHSNFDGVSTSSYQTESTTIGSTEVAGQGETSTEGVSELLTFESTKHPEILSQGESNNPEHGDGISEILHASAHSIAENETEHSIDENLYSNASESSLSEHSSPDSDSTEQGYTNEGLGTTAPDELNVDVVHSTKVDGLSFESITSDETENIQEAETLLASEGGALTLEHDPHENSLHAESSESGQTSEVTTPEGVDITKVVSANEAGLDDLSSSTNVSLDEIFSESLENEDLVHNLSIANLTSSNDDVDNDTNPNEADYETDKYGDHKEPQFPDSENSQVGSLPDNETTDNFSPTFIDNVGNETIFNPEVMAIFENATFLTTDEYKNEEDSEIVSPPEEENEQNQTLTTGYVISNEENKLGFENNEMDYSQTESEPHSPSISVDYNVLDAEEDVSHNVFVSNESTTHPESLEDVGTRNVSDLLHAESNSELINSPISTSTEEHTDFGTTLGLNNAGTYSEVNSESTEETSSLETFVDEATISDQTLNPQNSDDKTESLTHDSDLPEINSEAITPEMIGTVTDDGVSHTETDDTGSPFTESESTHIETLVPESFKSQHDIPFKNIADSEPGEESSETTPTPSEFLKDESVTTEGSSSSIDSSDFETEISEMTPNRENSDDEERSDPSELHLNSEEIAVNESDDPLVYDSEPISEETDVSALDVDHPQTVDSDETDVSALDVEHPQIVDSDGTDALDVEYPQTVDSDETVPNSGPSDIVTIPLSEEEISALDHSESSNGQNQEVSTDAPSKLKVQVLFGQHDYFTPSEETSGKAVPESPEIDGQPSDEGIATVDENNFGVAMHEYDENTNLSISPDSLLILTEEADRDGGATSENSSVDIDYNEQGGEESNDGFSNNHTSTSDLDALETERNDSSNNLPTLNNEIDSTAAVDTATGSPTFESDLQEHDHSQTDGQPNKTDSSSESSEITPSHDEFSVFGYLGNLFSEITTLSSVSTDSEISPIAIETASNRSEIEPSGNFDEHSEPSSELDIENSSLGSEIIEQSKDYKQNNSLETYGYAYLGGGFLTGNSKYSSYHLNNSDLSEGLDVKNTTLEQNLNVNTQDTDDGSQTIDTNLSQATEIEVLDAESSDHTPIESDNSKNHSQGDGDHIYSYLSNLFSTSNSTLTTEEAKDPEHLEISLENGESIIAGPEKGGDWFEPTLAVPIPEKPADFNVSTTVSNGQNDSDYASPLSNSEQKEGPEKGGEVFEPTLPNIFPLGSEEEKSESVPSVEIVTQPPSIIYASTISTSIHFSAEASDQSIVDASNSHALLEDNVQGENRGAETVPKIKYAAGETILATESRPYPILVQVSGLSASASDIETHIDLEESASTQNTANETIDNNMNSDKSSSDLEESTSTQNTAGETIDHNLNSDKSSTDVGGSIDHDLVSDKSNFGLEGSASTQNNSNETIEHNLNSDKSSSDLEESTSPPNTADETIEHNLNSDKSSSDLEESTSPPNTADETIEHNLNSDKSSSDLEGTIEHHSVSDNSTFGFEGSASTQNNSNETTETINRSLDSDKSPRNTDERRLKHLQPYSLIDVISNVFKAPGYDSEVHSRFLKEQAQITDKQSEPHQVVKRHEPSTVSLVHGYQIKDTYPPRGETIHVGGSVVGPAHEGGVSVPVSARITSPLIIVGGKNNNKGKVLGKRPIAIKEAPLPYYTSPPFQPSQTSETEH